MTTQALVAMLVYNMSKAVLHETIGEFVGQGLLCTASFWNAMVNRQRTNGGVNCLRPKVYKLYLPGPLASIVGASSRGRNANMWKVPDLLVFLCIMVVTLLPFSVYIFHEIDSG